MNYIVLAGVPYDIITSVNRLLDPASLATLFPTLPDPDQDHTRECKVDCKKLIPSQEKQMIMAKDI